MILQDPKHFCSNGQGLHPCRGGQVPCPSVNAQGGDLVVVLSGKVRPI